MKKTGDNRDKKRRYNYVRLLQDADDWRKTLPKANATWPTCLIISPSTVVHNWKRELETVRSGQIKFSVFVMIANRYSGVISKLVITQGHRDKKY
jgi:hypothetical protein